MTRATPCLKMPRLLRKALSILSAASIAALPVIAAPNAVQAANAPTHTAGPDYDTDCYTWGCYKYFNKAPKAGDGVCLSDFSKQFPAGPNEFYSTGRFLDYSVMISFSKSQSVGKWEKGVEPPWPVPFTRPDGVTVMLNKSDIQQITEVIDRKAYSTAYRPDFTSSAKEPVWTIPAGNNYWWWVIESDIGKSPIVNLPGPAPHYTGNTGPWGSTDRMAGSIYAGNWTFSRMLDDGIYSDSFLTYNMQNYGRNSLGQIGANFTPVHPDPQQFATRFVLKTPYAQNLKEFDYRRAPDIDVPDSAILAAAQENSSKLTDATLERLRSYADSGNVERNYLDLNANATIIDEMGSGYGGYDITRVDMGTEQASCGLFAEIVKHPRLPNVYMLKYFIRSIAWSGAVQPHYSWQYGATFIAYAPYLLGPAYEAPKLNPDSVSGPANEEVEIKPLDNDTAGSTGTLSLVSVSTPAHGTVTWNGNNVTYMPGSDFSGMDTMVYTVTDGVSNYSSTISVQIQSVPPKLNPDTVITGHTVPVTFNVLANDTDPDGPNPLRVTSVTQPEHGSLSWSANGAVTFTPENSFIGTFTASYTATDGISTSSSYIVFTTIQCFKDVWHDAGLQCDSRNPQGSADFAASCEYSPSGYDQEEIDCPVN